MIIEGIEIGKVWDGGFNDYCFQCRPAGSAEDFKIAIMYFEDFEFWRTGEVTLDEIKEMLDSNVYKNLKEMQKRA